MKFTHKRYPYLLTYVQVGDEQRPVQFSDSVYETNDKDEIAVLKQLPDVEASSGDKSSKSSS